MGNAVQYGDASEAITATIAGKDPAFVEISVHISGPTIPADVQKTIFDSWTRGQVEVQDGIRIWGWVFISQD